MAMASMARSEGEERATLMTRDIDGKPRIPEGMKLRLEEPEVAKIGVDFETGTKIPMMVVVEVVDAGKGEQGRYATLEVHQAGVLEQPDQSGRENALYGQKPAM